MNETVNSGKMIRKNMLHMFPGSFMYAAMIGFMFMVDSILAGNFVGAEGLSAVAIGLPVYGMFLALMNAIVHGTSLRVTWAKGRGDHPEFVRAFAGGFYFAGIAGLIFTGIILSVSRPLAMVFGGANSSSVILEYSVLYLRCCAPMVFLSAISGALRECIGVLGYQTERAGLGIFNMICNAVLSVILVTSFPQDIKMAALGIGSSSAAFLEFMAALIIMRLRKVDVSLKPVFLRPKEMLETLKSGLPASLDSVIDCAISAVVNNLILTGFPAEPLILSVVHCVQNIKKIVRYAPTGTGYMAAPLFGIFYAERDKNSLRRSMAEAFRIGFIATVIWGVICYAALPLLTRLSGMEVTADIRTGALILILCIPGYLCVYLFTVFYESTERFGSSLIMASIPDSVLYPILLFVLIRTMGKLGMWIAYGANPLIGFILLVPFMMLLSRKNPTPMDRMMRLKPQIVERSPEFDFEINSTEETAVGVSEKIGAFLKQAGKPDRISYIASLSTEELAVDMITYLKEHPADEKISGKLLDIKLFDDGDTIEILIRSFGKGYDPLDFTTDPEDLRKIGVRMVQKIAETVNYTYVYKLNVVSIVLNTSDNK